METCLRFFTEISGHEILITEYSGINIPVPRKKEFVFLDTVINDNYLIRDIFEWKVKNVMYSYCEEDKIMIDIVLEPHELYEDELC